mmetsp:Transcript_57227/g.133428  ORF Transcript_57227/g.133428 Transcript_57227/m.133428 type:complete len:111 (-) Transcript_57227:113-445(-)
MREPILLQKELERELTSKNFFNLLSLLNWDPMRAAERKPSELEVLAADFKESFILPASTPGALSIRGGVIITLGVTTLGTCSPLASANCDSWFALRKKRCGKGDHRIVEP